MVQEIKLTKTSVIKVEKSDYMGKTYLKIRIWHDKTPNFKGDGTYTGPDKQGMNLLFDGELINKLVEAINLEAFGSFEPASEKEQMELTPEERHKLESEEIPSDG
jgi:hypothetical protein